MGRMTAPADKTLVKIFVRAKMSKKEGSHIFQLANRINTCTQPLGSVNPCVISKAVLEAEIILEHERKKPHPRKRKSPMVSIETLTLDNCYPDECK